VRGSDVARRVADHEDLVAREGAAGAHAAARDGGAHQLGAAVYRCGGVVAEAAKCKPIP
jgi:hypothetical protein